MHRDPETLVTTFRNLRRRVDIHSEVSVVRDISSREVRLYTDSGRVCRPLLIVDTDKQLKIKVLIN
jgi:DNA-directed RNA polymerase II subunit RPB2